MIDPALVARAARDCAALIGRVPDADRPLGIAVSGGPDSMALLLLAGAAFPGAVRAATVDHHLRPESGAEAAMVGQWCQDNGIVHAVLADPDEPITGSGIQAKARALRYRLLARWAAEEAGCAVATAHHADDQGETFLMRAARGSGIAGLRGIPACGMLDGGVPVIRPLLAWRRTQLAELLAAADAPFVTDPGNADPAHERVRVRQWLVDHPELDAGALARSAARLAEVDSDLTAMHDWLWQDRRRVPDGRDAAVQAWIDIAGLPRELRRRLARSAILAVRAACGIADPPFDRATDVEPLLDRLDAGQPGMKGGVVARPVGPVWRFAPAPPRRSP